ncbi:MAG: hypothetical protein ABIA04_01340 [Pseudomonadota bacterium]
MKYTIPKIHNIDINPTEAACVANGSAATQIGSQVLCCAEGGGLNSEGADCSSGGYVSSWANMCFQGNGNIGSYPRLSCASGTGVTSGSCADGSNFDNNVYDSCVAGT